MQIKLGSYNELHAALVRVRNIVDEIPAYHGKEFSYTIYPERNKYSIYISRKENIYGSK